jgi:hypothetical protein
MGQSASKLEKQQLAQSAAFHKVSCRLATTSGLEPLVHPQEATANEKNLTTGTHGISVIMMLQTSTGPSKNVNSAMSANPCTIGDSLFSKRSAKFAVSNTILE